MARLMLLVLPGNFFLNGLKLFKGKHQQLHNQTPTISFTSYSIVGDP